LVASFMAMASIAATRNTAARPLRGASDQRADLDVDP
jgi:hypothetical protein